MPATMPEILLAISLSPLILFALIAALNVFSFPRLRAAPPPQTAPRVSVLIPMRNESAVIAPTIQSLLAQDYPNLEILLLDDQSVDDSAAVALSAAGQDPRLSVITGDSPPPGWLGKPWACHQLIKHATGDYLLFTDADVRWQPGAISALVHEAQKTRADLLTVWPTQETVTWSERLVIPLMGFSILAYLPALAVHHSPWPVFAAAIGQCLLFRRAAYDEIGGHAAIKSAILDDMAFAYAIKRHNLRLRCAEAAGFIVTRMYQNWAQVRDGYAKNIIAGHGDSLAFLAFSTIFHCWMFIAPWLWATLSGGQLLPILFTLLGVSTRLLAAKFTGQRLRDAFLMPVSVILMTIIALRAVQWRLIGGGQWKGREIPRKS